MRWEGARKYSAFFLLHYLLSYQFKDYVENVAVSDRLEELLYSLNIEIERVRGFVFLFLFIPIRSIVLKQISSI